MLKYVCFHQVSVGTILRITLEGNDVTTLSTVAKEGSIRIPVKLNGVSSIQGEIQRRNLSISF